MKGRKQIVEFQREYVAIAWKGKRERLPESPGGGDVQVMKDEARRVLDGVGRINMVPARSGW